MTNTPSIDEELIEAKDALFKLRSLKVMCEACSQPLYVTILDETLPVLEQLLSDKARLTEALADNAELRSERDALLQKPIDLAKLDSIDEDASGKMVAYYWWQQAQDAREALKDERSLVPPTNEG